MKPKTKDHAAQKPVLPEGVRNVIAVGAGKGGVGKSSVSANLAVSLASAGAKVGLLDADIYGPNLPQMFGIREFRPSADKEGRVEPAFNHGVKLFSMGFFIQTDVPVAWRGPMLHNAIRQFMRDVRWGELDVLIVDLPPGTGDVQLSLSQTVPIGGALLVTTPQSLALSDVRKALAMMGKLEIPILGIVENMSYLKCPHCGKDTKVFSGGGGKSLSASHGIPLLGEIPLDPALCESGESGTPLALSHPESPVATAFGGLAREVAALLEIGLEARD